MPSTVPSRIKWKPCTQGGISGWIAPDTGYPGFQGVIFSRKDGSGFGYFLIRNKKIIHVDDSRYMSESEVRQVFDETLRFWVDCTIDRMPVMSKG